MRKILPKRMFSLVSAISLGSFSAGLQYKLLVRNFSFEIEFQTL